MIITHIPPPPHIHFSLTTGHFCIASTEANARGRDSYQFLVKRHCTAAPNACADGRGSGFALYLHGNQSQERI